MPLTLVNVWKEEFSKWAIDVPVYDCTSNVPKKERMNYFKECQESEKGGVCLLTYGLISKNVELLLTSTPEKIVRDAKDKILTVPNKYVWDYTIMDEGHKIKGNSNTTKMASMIEDKHRLIMTGTPIMNKLDDLWQLFNWVTKGRLLGNRKNFQDNIGRHITKGREKNAFMSEKRHAQMCTIKLKNMIAPYYIQRRKKDVGLQVDFRTHSQQSIKRLI